jgi:spermidine/putrescine transport system substrate-binding protein
MQDNFLTQSAANALESGAERRTPNCRERFHAVLKNIAAIWSAALRAAFRTPLTVNGFSLTKTANRGSLLFVLSVILTSIPTTPIRAAESTLRLFIWSEYIDPAVVADFEKVHQCKVVINLYEEAESMMAKVQAAGGGTFDVVVPPDHMVQPMAKLGLLSPLKKEALPNLKNIDAKFLKAPFDPDNKYSVPYQWGTVGIYIRTPKGSAPIEPTWGLFFDPKQQPGSFYLIDSMRDTIGAALKYKGHSFNSTKPAELKEARDLVLSAKKRAVGFEASVGNKNKVVSKAARAAIVYSGEGARGMTEDAETTYIIPREGSQIWLDNLVILANAPHKELAAKFINYVMDPKVAARISNFTQFSTPNQPAREFIDPDLLKNPAIYPPDDIMAKLEFLTDLGPNLRLYDEVWTQIKAR